MRRRASLLVRLARNEAHPDREPVLHALPEGVAGDQRADQPLVEGDAQSGYPCAVRLPGP
jgi:hypothetical protein